MVHYVECGTEFAVQYGYGDEAFFESLDAMFTQVVKTLQKSEQKVIDRLLPRLCVRRGTTRYANRGETRKTPFSAKFI
jgi:hypothetical protein